MELYSISMQHIKHQQMRNSWYERWHSSSNSNLIWQQHEYNNDNDWQLKTPIMTLMWWHTHMPTLLGPNWVPIIIPELHTQNVPRYYIWHPTLTFLIIVGLCLYQDNCRNQVDTASRHLWWHLNTLSLLSLAADENLRYNLDQDLGQL